MRILVMDDSVDHRLVAVNRDLNRRVREQASELQAIEARFRAIFDSTFEFIGLLTPDGTVVEINQAALSFGGLTREEVVGRPFWAARWWSLSPTTQDQLKDAIGRAGQGEFVRYTAEVLGDVDRVASIDFVLKPVRDAAGHVIYLLPEGHDITELKRAEVEQQRYVEQLRILSQRLVEVQENERRAIARELHDEAGQSLTALKLGLGLLEREAMQPAQVVARARELEAVADNVMEDLHRLAARLRPAALDRVGLVPALEQFVNAFERINGLRTQFAALGLDGVRLAPDVEITLYRIVQESLTNVARHAHATRVDVLLRRQNDRIAGLIEDDGIGFALSEACRGGRLGLFGMQERAEVLGGKLQVESEPGRGTTVYVELPWC